MKRRELYTLVAEQADRAGGAKPFLTAAIDAMRGLRGLSGDDGKLATGILDSELLPILRDDDALGQIYQALNAPALEAAYRGTARERRKFSEAEIPSVTQLFTPRFVVEFLLQYTLGRLSGRRVRDIRILDPACGTMNFGVVAIEMLDAMYREELARLGPERASVSSEDQIPLAILTDNLFGIDIDPVALDLAAHTLSIKLRISVEHCRDNLWLGDALFDREIERRCAGGFDVVVTNPPYLSARNLRVETVARMKRSYPCAWRDVYACFIDRSMQFVREGGYVGILAMQSFMFTGAFEKFRQDLAGRAAIDAIAHFGPGLFEVGNPGTLQTAAVVLRRESDESRRASNELIAIRLVDADDKNDAMTRSIEQRQFLRIRQGDLLRSPRSAWVYWMTPAMSRVFANCPKLKQIAEPRQGLATTDNARFVRYWWEVEPTRADAPCRASSDTWFAYVKSGRFRRWFESPRHRVNWADDGRQIKESIARRYPYLKGRWEWVAKNSQFYGRGGVTYSYLTAGAFSARLMPAGAIFDVAGSAMFPDDPFTLLAILNSSIARELLHAINPTVNFQVGDLAQLPLPCESDEPLAAMARRAVELQRSLDAHDETSPQFIAPASWDGADDHSTRLTRLESEINSAIARLYDIPAPAESESPFAVDRVELARRWISFAVGCLLGRWNCDRAIEVLALRPVCAATIDRIRAKLVQLAGARAAGEMEDCVGGIGAFLAGPFYPWHVKLYRSRPVYWALGDRDRASLVLHDFATSRVLSTLVLLPRGWERFVDDGVAVNLAAICDRVADGALSRKLAESQSDLNAGRFEWSQTQAALKGEAMNRESAGGPARRPRPAGPAPAARR